MGKRDPRVDAYIARSAEFARPILGHLRRVVHEAAPTVVETIKWGMPHFDHNGMLCGMAAFKAHVTFGFWKGSLVVAAKHDKGGEAMGSFGRITRLGDLPSATTLKAYVRKAVALNDAGVKARPLKRAPAPKRAPRTPPALAGALRKAPRAHATWERLSPSHRREYIEWVTEAKGPETRARRLATTVEWLAEGKSRNWKYMKKGKA